MRIFLGILLFLQTGLFGWDSQEMEERLLTEEIVSKIPMKDFLEEKGMVAHFTSPVFLVELSSGLKAVLKLSDPLWPQDAVVETAAYRLSCFLNLNFVPPTVIYSRNEQIGSLQLYIEPTVDLMQEDNYAAFMQKLSQEDLANISLFYFVFGQWDRGPSNLIAMQEESRLQVALIDNAAMGFLQKVRFGEHPFVLSFPNVVFEEDGLGEFPFDTARTLPPDPAVWKKEFGQYLSDKNIKQLCNLKRPVVFAIWKNRFWRQYGFSEPSYTEIFPKNTMERLKSLDQNTLKKLFRNDLGFEFSQEYFDDILNRRDQVLETYHLVNLKK